MYNPRSLSYTFLHNHTQRNISMWWWTAALTTLDSGAHVIHTVFLRIRQTVRCLLYALCVLVTGSSAILFGCDVHDYSIDTVVIYSDYTRIKVVASIWNRFPNKAHSGFRRMNSFRFGLILASMYTNTCSSSTRKRTQNLLNEITSASIKLIGSIELFFINIDLRRPSSVHKVSGKALLFSLERIHPSKNERISTFVAFMHSMLWGSINENRM